MTQQIIFFVFGAIALGAGVAVVTTRRVFHAALWLLLAFFGVAGLFVLLEAPFFAAVQLFVYMGAIGVLIVFALMLTQGVMSEERTGPNNWAIVGVLVAQVVVAIVHVVFEIPFNTYLIAVAVLVALTLVLGLLIKDEGGKSFNEQWAMALVVAPVLMVAMDYVINTIPFTGEAPPPLTEDSLYLLGMAFVSPESFALPFEVASVLLVAALLGAVVIAKER